MILDRQLKYKLAPRRLYGRWTGPRVLLASPAKTGTNLMIRVLELFPQLRPAGLANGPPQERLMHFERISQIRRGQFVITHYSINGLEDVLEERDFRGIFVIRDPRDVAVSLAHYIMREPRHWCHNYFHEVLENHSQRLMATIRGDEKSNLKTIDGHFRSRMAYMNHPRFYTVRFEEMIGSEGGGDDLLQRSTIESIADHLKVKLTNHDLQRIALDAFSTSSPTFRKGKIGSWKEEMEPEHIEAFIDVAGDLLCELGYEETLEWR